MKKIYLFLLMLIVGVGSTWADTESVTIPTTSTMLGIATGGVIGGDNSLPTAVAIQKLFASKGSGLYYGNGNGSTVSGYTGDLSNVTTTGFSYNGRTGMSGSYVGLVYYEPLKSVSDISVSFTTADKASGTQATFSIWTYDSNTGTATMVANSASDWALGSQSFTKSGLSVGGTSKLILVWNGNTAGEKNTISDFSCTLTYTAQASAVIATTKGIVNAATVNTATAVTDWKTSVENGGIYSFASDTYIGAASMSAVTKAYAGSNYVTVAAWVYGQPSGCIFGFGEQSTGVKYYVNGQTMKMTTKNVSDFASQDNTGLVADQWNLIAYEIPGTANTATGNISRFYCTATDGQFWSKSKSTMNTTANNQCAIGSGNSDGAREAYTGMIANLIVIESTSQLNNSAIASLLGAAPTANIWGQPQFGGTVWTWNTSNSNFDADGQTSTATPSRLNSMGPVYKFSDAGTVTTAVNTSTDTSDGGGVWVISSDKDNVSNVTTNFGRWAGSVLVSTYSVASVNYSSSLKGTEADGYATVWTDGDLTITGRTTFDMNDGNNQRWFVGKNGIIRTSFNNISRGSRTWSFQVELGTKHADDTAIEGVPYKTLEDKRTIMTTSGNMSSYISGVTCIRDNAVVTSATVSYDDNGMYVTETYNGYDLDLFDADLQAAIDAAEALIGTDPGCIKEADARSYITAAKTALAATDRTVKSVYTATTTLNTAISGLTLITPVSGKTYQIICAMPAFKTQQSVEKAMYANGDNLSWNTVNTVNHEYFWTLVPSEDGTTYTMTNQSSSATKLYPGVQATQSSAYPMSETSVAVTLTNIGLKQFNLKTAGSGYSMHTGGHSNGAGVSGNIVAWNGGTNTGSAWYIREVEMPTTADVTYQIKDGDNVLWSQVKTGKIGEAYPTPVFDNTFITLSGVPTETLTEGDKTVVLTYTTENMPFEINTDAASATKFYALDVHGNEAKYPVYADDDNMRVEYTARTDADDYTKGAVKSNSYVWAFVGNPISGVKLYNKGTGEYAIMSSDADEKLTMGTDGTTFGIYNTNGTVANSFALKVKSYNNYMNHRDTYVQGWTDNDEGSSFRCYAVNVTDASLDVTVGSSSYTKYSKCFNTLVVPFYSAIPDGVNVYTVTADTEGALTLEEQTDLVKPFTAYLIKGSNNTKYTFSNTTAGTSTDEVTTGNLHGVLIVTSLSSGYVLATSKSAQTQAFMQLGTKITLGKNKCYLTLPAEAEARGITTVYLPGMDTPTAISEVFGGESTLCDGKYIQDGKVVIVKNNAKYNVTGQKID